MPMAQVHSEEQPLEKPWLSKGILAMIAILSSICIGFAGIVCYRAAHPPGMSANSILELDGSAIVVRQLGELGTSDPMQELMLHMSTGNSEREQGHYAEAATQFTVAQHIASQLGDQQRLVEAWIQLGVVRLLQGRLIEALTITEKAQDSLQKCGSDHASAADMRQQTASVLHALGNIRREMGNIHIAIDLYGEAWDMLATTSIYHERIRGLLADLGDAYLEAGMFEKALEYLQKASRLQKPLPEQLQQHRTIEELDSARLNSLIASASYLRGDAAGTLELCTKALRVQAKLLRAGHPDLIFSRLLAARTQRDLGNSGSALQAMEAVEKTLRTSDPESQQLSHVLIEKADLLRELGKLHAAELSMKEAFALQTKGLGKEYTPEVGNAHQTYGSILQDQGRLKEAGKEYLFALDVNLKTVGHWHPQTAAAHNSLGTLYQDRGRYSQAREHFEACLGIQLRTAGGSSPDVASTYSNIATVMFQQGDQAGAAELLRRSLAMLDSAHVPKNSPDRAVYADNLNALQQLRMSPAANNGEAARPSWGATSVPASPVLSLAE